MLTLDIYSSTGVSLLKMSLLYQKLGTLYMQFILSILLPLDLSGIPFFLILVPLLTFSLMIWWFKFSITITYKNRNINIIFSLYLFNFYGSMALFIHYILLYITSTISNFFVHYFSQTLNLSTSFKENIWETVNQNGKKIPDTFLRTIKYFQVT